MLVLIKEFNEITNFGEKQTHKSERIMNELYSKYIDKIINGIIYAPMYKYYKWGDIDDLVNEARHKVYLSIKNNQFDPTKGNSIFSFLSTVVSRNLLTYTLNQNRHRNKKSDLDLDIIFNSQNFRYNEDFDKNFVIKIVFDEITAFFDKKEKYQNLSKLLEDYYKTHMGSKFIKKQFIEYARVYGFSSSFVNSFFNKLKKIKSVKKLLAEVHVPNKKFIDG